MNRRTPCGFTLVEVLASIMVIGAIGAVAGVMLHRGVEGYQGATSAAHLHQEVASALDRIDRALREIPAVAGEAYADIKMVTPGSVDWDSIDGASSLTLSDGRLYLAILSADPLVLISGVTAFEVRCFDENNSTLAGTLSGAATQDIRRIEVTLTVSRDGLSDTLRTRVFLRSTMAGGGS